MIIDSLSQASKYFSVNPRFAKAFEYLAQIDLPTVAEGRYTIQGDDIFMMIIDNKALKDPKDAALEVHDKYIDIQVIIKGVESFGWKQRVECTSERAAMDTEKDIQFFNDTPSTYFTLNPFEFTILLPEDAHAPLVGTGTVKKCIIKVLA